MTSTYTPNKDFELPGYNDYVDSWNTPVNTNFTELDTALGGSTLFNATGASGDTVLTVTQYRPPQIIVSGVLSANVRLVVPAGVGGQWTVTNGATGGPTYSLTMASAAGGSNITIPSGTTIVSCDGSASGMRLSITSTSVQRVDSFNAGSTGLTPAYAAVGQITLGGTLNIANGGTQTSTAPTSGQLLIGRSDGTYAVNNLTGGSGITINNGNGSIEIVASSTAGGTVTSIGLAAGTTGMTWNGATSAQTTTSQTFTLGGTLAIANGGTGSTSTPASGQFLIGTGTAYSLGTITNGGGIGISVVSGNIQLTNSGVLSLTSSLNGISVGTGTGAVTISGTLGVTSGGTGVTTSTGSGSVVLSNSPTLVTPALGTPASGNLSNCTGYSSSALNGTIPIAQGGTNATTAATALSNLGGASLTSNNTFTGTQTAPSYLLAANNARFYTGSGGTASYTIIDFNSTSNLYYNGTNQYEFSIQGNARLTITNSGIQAVSYSNYSDRALKKDITPVQGGLNRVLQYQPVTFKWLDPSINGDKLNEGFIAQDVALVNPIPVTYDDKGVALLDYGPLVADLVSAIQELTARVQALEAKVP